MKILLVNPNSSDEMTRAIEDTARRAASPQTAVGAVTSPKAPAALEGYYDEALAIGPMLEILAQETRTWDAFIIACHGDPGIEAARELIRKPVIGIGEASFLAACAFGRRFSLITLLERLIPKKRDQIRRCGLESRLASIRVLGAGVLESFHNLDALGDRFLEAGRRAVEEDGAEAIVLGCAGVGGVREALEQKLGVPVIDGVVAAVKLAEQCGPRP